MSIFDDANQPNSLAPIHFRDFALHAMAGYYVDLTQPFMWTHICREDGTGVPTARIGREVNKRIAPLGAVLTPNLLNKIVATYRIHGPEIAQEFSHAAREA